MTEHAQGHFIALVLVTKHTVSAIRPIANKCKWLTVILILKISCFVHKASLISSRYATTASHRKLQANKGRQMYEVTENTYGILIYNKVQLQMKAPIMSNSMNKVDHHYIQQPSCSITQSTINAVSSQLHQI